MNADLDLVKLYSKQILALAAAIPCTERLVDPDISIRKRAPLCGSNVSIDVNFSEGLITDYGQDVKACALGQAAASVVGANIIGRNRNEVVAARDQLSAMLKSGGPVPEVPFDGLEVLLPAQDHKSRHASILLTLGALVEAFDQVNNSAKP